jgi:uncharacterized protein with ATP-grasp and redox domains
MNVDSAVQTATKDEGLERHRDNVMKLSVVEVVTDKNPYKEVDKAKEKSKQVLSELKKILQNNSNFCTEL